MAYIVMAYIVMAYIVGLYRCRGARISSSAYGTCRRRWSRYPPATTETKPISMISAESGLSDLGADVDRRLSAFSHDTVGIVVGRLIVWIGCLQFVGVYQRVPWTRLFVGVYQRVPWTRLFVGVQERMGGCVAGVQHTSDFDLENGCYIAGTAKLFSVGDEGGTASSDLVVRH